MDSKEASNQVGEILNDFLKTGAKSPEYANAIKSKILEIVHRIVESPKEATKEYAACCKSFLGEVKKAKGLPTIEVLGDGANGGRIVSSSGNHIADNFQRLIPTLNERYNACVEIYQRQSQLYFEGQVQQFEGLLWEFLGKIPTDGTKDKSIRSQISAIKRELRALPNWSDLFAIYKQNSFTTEIEHVFALEGGAIAAVWHYSQADEEGEFQKTYDHRERDHRVYAVRANWAMEKGLMQGGPFDNLEEITLPQLEVGCGCYLRYVYTLRELPEVMLTEKGRAELLRVEQPMDRLFDRPATIRDVPVEMTNVPTFTRPVQKGLKRRLLSWLHRR
jgi:hypothetical protein